MTGDSLNILPVGPGGGGNTLAPGSQHHALYRVVMFSSTRKLVNLSCDLAAEPPIILNVLSTFNKKDSTGACIGFSFATTPPLELFHAFP
jgi:hypothetical protein